MTNRLLGMFAASLLAVSACGGENETTDESAQTLASEFQTAENRASAGGGSNGQGRGNCEGGGRMGRGGRGKGKAGEGNDERRSGRGDADGDVDEAADEAAGDDEPRGARGDVDSDVDEAADEATGGNKAGGRAKGGVRPPRGRCSDDDGPSVEGAQRDGGVQRDAGVRPTRSDAGVQGGVRGPRDAGSPSPGPLTPVPSNPPSTGETVRLPDGTTVRLDTSCPSLTRSGVTLPGCCLAAHTCGLSTHLIDVTGVPKGCQSYEQGRMVDPTFDLATKACIFRN